LNIWGVHMKRVVSLVSFLILFWVFSGVAVAQSLTGLTGPLDGAVNKVTSPVDKVVDKVTSPVDKVTSPVDKVTSPVDKVTSPVDKVKEVVDKVTKPVTDALPAPVKNPVDKVVKDVGKAVDNVVKDVTDTGNKAAAPGKNAPLPGVNSGDNPNNTPEVGSGLDRSTNRPASRASQSKAARTSKSSAKSSRGANRPEPARDTEQVAAAGNSIEPGEVRGTHIIAPATDAAEESQGSGLSLTGVQILTWLILAAGLVGAGAALFLSGRIRLRTASS
jgi:uncharacterized protein YoxC